MPLLREILLQKGARQPPPQGIQKRSTKKNGPVITRPFGREAGILTLFIGDMWPCREEMSRLADKIIARGRHGSANRAIRPSDLIDPGLNRQEKAGTRPEKPSFRAVE
jgi:hypothetical protein